MPKIKSIIPKKSILVSEKHKFAVEYECQCGRIIRYYDYKRPKKLSKCFKCL